MIANAPGPPPSQFVSRGKVDRIRPVKPQDQSRVGAVALGHPRATNGVPI